MILRFRAIVILMVCLIGTTTVFAQRSMGTSYRSALGFKFYPSSVTFKQAVSDKNAIEAIVAFWEEGARYIVLYEVHHTIEGVKGLRWYVGPGVHISDYYKSYYGGEKYLGLDGVIGLDWKINRTPFNVSLDWQPSFDFGGGKDFTWKFGGLSLRYALR